MSVFCLFNTELSKFMITIIDNCLLNISSWPVLFVKITSKLKNSVKIIIYMSRRYGIFPKFCQCHHKIFGD